MGEPHRCLVDTTGLLEEFGGLSLNPPDGTVCTTGGMEEHDIGAPRRLSGDDNMPEGYEAAIDALDDATVAVTSTVPPSVQNGLGDVAPPLPVIEGGRSQRKHCARVRAWNNPAPPFGVQKRRGTKALNRKKRRVKERQERRVVRRKETKKKERDTEEGPGWLVEGQPAPDWGARRAEAYRQKRMADGYWSMWKKVPRRVKIGTVEDYVIEEKVTLVPREGPPSCAPVPVIRNDPLFELLFDKEITWLGTTHIHRDWAAVSVCVLVEREGVFRWNSKGTQIPAGLLLVAPIWAEHQQAYIDHGCPWYLMGRGVTYVPIGVHRWRMPLGLHGMVLDFLIGGKAQQISLCNGLRCSSREYWGISGLNKEGRPTGGWFDEGDWTCKWKRDCSEAAVTPMEWKWRDRDLSHTSPEGYCHRCLWIPPVKRVEAFPLFQPPEFWDVLWEQRGLRGANWLLVLEYLKPPVCSNRQCGRVLNLPGARQGLGGEYHMISLESSCDAAFRPEEEAFLRGNKRCVYCMTPWQPSATYGFDDPENDDAAARRHLYRARQVNAEWAGDRFEKKLKRRVLDVRWVGDMFWRWAKNESMVSGGRFNYLYWVGLDTRWGTEESISGCLLGHGVGTMEPGGRDAADFDIGLSVRARDGMYERSGHSGIAVYEPTEIEKGRAWSHAVTEGKKLLKHTLDHQGYWLPPVMDECAHSPGKVAIRTRYGGVLLPHEMHGACFVNHVGRVCDKRRGWCPYADKFDLRLLPPLERRVIAAIRERVGSQGANRGRKDPYTGFRIGQVTEAWGPPIEDDVPGKVPKYWEVC